MQLSKPSKIIKKTANPDFIIITISIEIDYVIQITC